MFLFSFITDVNRFFEIPTPPPAYFDPARLLNLTKISNAPPPFILTLPFIRYLRVHTHIANSSYTYLRSNCKYLHLHIYTQIFIRVIAYFFPN